MKKMNLFLAVLIAFACSQPAQKNSTANQPFNEVAEKSAIMETIVNETESFYKRDYEGWKKNFAQTDYAFQAWSNADGTFDAKTGWDEVDKKIGAYIKANPVEAGKSSYPRVERKNMVIKFFSEKLAYLVWDQYNSDKDGLTFLLSKDQRIMEKIDGEWKIVNVSSYWDYQNVIPADSVYNL
jgi:hypothetical protein